MKLSSVTRDRLSKELEHIIMVLSPAAQIASEAAMGQGDMSQNPDYFVMAEEQRQLAAREAYLRVTLASDLASTADVLADGCVRVGSVVTLDFGDGPEEFLFGSIEEEASGVSVVTPTSPLGVALLGVSAGVRVKSPSGAIVRVLAVA